MSRTDKDNPWWVRADYYEPYHYCGWRKVGKYVDTDRPYPWNPEKFFRRRVGCEWKYFGDCELPETPIRENPRRYRKRNPNLCGWDAVWPHDYNMQMRGRSVKKDCHTEFHGPQRAAVRDAAREVIKGNHEIEFPDGRTRHSVLWDLS